MSFELVRVEIAALLGALLFAVCAGFLLRMWVGSRRISIEYERLQGWQRALQYVRWGSWLILWGSFLAFSAEWSATAITGSVLFIILFVLVHRARAIVRVWMEQSDAGQRLT